MSRQLLLPEFEPKIRLACDLDALEAQADSVTVLMPDTTIAYINPAWTRFARDNGGAGLEVCDWGLGSRYLDVVPAPLKPFYTDLLHNAPGAADTLTPTVHEYECSSAALYRRYAMHVYPLREHVGWLIVHSRTVVTPHDPAERLALEPLLEKYQAENGFVTQCSHCRRIRDANDPVRWDWVPAWVDSPLPNISHGICLPCWRHYYPGKDSP